MENYLVFCGLKSESDYESLYAFESNSLVHDDSFGDVMMMDSDYVISIGLSDQGIEVVCKRLGDNKFRLYCDKLFYADEWLTKAINTFSHDEARYRNIRDGVGAFGYYDRSNVPKWRDEMKSAQAKSKESGSRYVDTLKWFLDSNS